MRLLKLSANQPTFRTVTFRREGLSLVVAEQKTPKSSQKKTYNGVGKSLMLEILHFCLGSKKRQAFEKHLKGWVFTLEVEVNGASHTISRRADKPDILHLDDGPIKMPRLKNFLEEACLETTIPYLTFKSAMSRFIRSGRGAYVDFLRTSSKENTYTSMINTAYLLGLDPHLAKTKYNLRDRKKNLEQAIRQLKKDPVFSALMAAETVDIELAAIKGRVEELRQDLKAFRVAKDFHDIEKEANATKQTLDRNRREEIKLGNAIAQIDRSMQTKSDLSPDRVFQLYEEAEAALPELVQVRVEEVLMFHQELQKKRIYRLSRERQQLGRELDAYKEQINKLSTELDERLRYLSEHRALDEYVAVNNELSESQQKMAKLEDSKALRGKVDHELRTIDVDLAQENLRAGEYIESSEALITEATSRFRSYAQDLYGSRPSGLSITNDSGDNQLRYRIDAHIRADAAEGINEVKIFCFDMTLLSLRRGHRFELLAHDSTLFGPIDPRQRLGMFRIADRVARDLGVQYIATLNSHDVTSIREQVDVDDAELERLFEDSVVLRLTDESPASKLLGIDVDLGDYTK
jgi:uncharacterized protein YydD (DUF2326 family)